MPGDAFHRIMQRDRVKGVHYPEADVCVVEFRYLKYLSKFYWKDRGGIIQGSMVFVCERKTAMILKDRIRENLRNTEVPERILLEG